MKAIFIVTTFEISLFKGRLILTPSQQGAGSKRIKFLVKNQKKLWPLLQLLEKWLTYKLRRFRIVLIFLISNMYYVFLKISTIYLNLSVPQKFKK